MVEYLRDEFLRRQKKNPSYSIRSFARAMRIHPSTLSAVLAHRRPLTPKTAKKLFDHLDISAQTRNRLLLETFRQKSTSDQTQVRLEEGVLEIISGWEHFAILSLLVTDKAKSDSKWIAQKLDLSVVAVNSAIDRLEKHGLLTRQGRRLLVTHKSLTTSQDIPSATLRRAHQQYIEKALYSLENHPVEERDITGVTLSISKEKIPEAKVMIREFRRQMAEFLESGSKDEVYRINIQMFPIKK